MEQGITVITPTFNRAYTLQRLYDSLCEQSYTAFEWIIIDDGSTDETRELVRSWINDSRIDVKYFYQENSGKHIAHNLGVNNAKYDLVTCLDSDDWFYPETLSTVNLYRRDILEEGNCGLIGLDTFENGVVVGDEFPVHSNVYSWSEIIFKEKVSGDKTIFFKTEVIKKYPFPEGNDDKHMPPSYQLFLMSKKYKFRVINNKLKFVEYLPDGITNNIRTKYEIAPNNYATYRMLMINISPNFFFKLRSLVLLNLSNFYSNKKIKYNQLNLKDRVLARLVIPISYMYYLVLRSKKGEKV